MTIRTREIVEETIRNQVATPTVLIVRYIICLTVSVVIFVVGGLEVSRLENRFNTDVEAGLYVWQISSQSREFGLSVADCFRLSSLPGVLASGAVVSTIAVTAANKPQARYELDSVTAGLVDVLWPHTLKSFDRGIIAGSQVAVELGLTVGSSVRLTDDAGASVFGIVSAVMPPSLRASAYDRRFVAVSAPLGESSSCIVDAEAGVFQPVGSVLASQFSGSAGVAIARYNLTDKPPSNPNTLLEDSNYLRYWIPAATFLIVLSLGTWIGRRGDYALYYLLGCTRWKMILGLTTETLMVVVLPVFAGMGISLVAIAHHASIIVLEVISTNFILLLFATSLIPLLGLVVLRKSIVVETVKGR